MNELEVYKTMTIEEFLYEFDLVSEASIDSISNKIRYKKTNAMKIDINSDGIVEIRSGVFKGNRARIVSQYEQKLKVRILDDKYINVVVIDVNDLATTCEEIKTTYILT